MRWTAFLVLVAGLGMAAYAAFAAQGIIEEIRAENTVVQEVPTEPVVVFRADLPQGHVVTDADLIEVDYTTGALPPSRVENAMAAVGAYIVRDVQAGTPVLLPMVSQEPIEMRPVYVRTRRGTEVTHTCVLRCPEPEL